MNKLENIYNLATLLYEHHEELVKSPDEFKEAIEALRKAKKDVDAGFKDKIKGGLADKKKPSDFDSDSLADGIKVELEHTNDKDMAREIAMDHLTEDKHYYKKLKVMEKAKKDEYEKHGMSVVDDPNQDLEGDEADQWLKENEGKKDAPAESKNDPQGAPSTKKYLNDWKPRSDYSDKEKKDIEEHMKQGYSHREAERMAGAHKGPTDFASALKHSIAPSMLSDKMLEQLKPLSKEWLDNASMKEKLSADPEKNPVKFAAGKLHQAHSNNAADYSKAYSEFLASDKLKDLSPRDRHKATQEWKANYHKTNPSYKEGLTSDVSDAQKQYGEAKGQSDTRRKEAMAHIATGGLSMPSEISNEEAMQHVGAIRDEEGNHAGGSVIKDPSAIFAQRNPKIHAMLNDDQKERMKRIDSAAASQGVVRIRKKGAPK